MLQRIRQQASRPIGGERGFTLAETLVVMMFVGMVAALGAPAFNNYRRSMNLTSAAQTFKTVVYQARLMSIYQGKIHFVVIDPGDRSVTIVEDSSVPRGTLDAGDTEVQHTRWATTVKLGLPAAPADLKHPITGADLDAGWAMPAPAAWSAGLLGVILVPNGRILSAEAPPATITNGAIVFNDSPGGTGSTTVSVDGISGSIRAYRMHEGEWVEL
jgi:type II secretion system protein H